MLRRVYLFSIFRSAAIAATIFGTMLCAQTASGQPIDSVDAGDTERYQQKFDALIQGMQLAIDRCDPYEYSRQRSEYEDWKRFSQLGPAPEYPVPCSRRLRTTNIRTANPIKRYSVGTLVKPKPEERQEIGLSNQPRVIDGSRFGTRPGLEPESEFKFGFSYRNTPSVWVDYPYVGGELIKNSGRVRTTETFAATGAITNQFSDSGDPIGLGIVAGYNFRPWNNNIVVGPFASFDFLNQTINHTFAGGQFLGTTTHWIATVGAKGGYIVAPGVYLYGLAGASWLNHNLNVNFATAASSNVTTPGFTLGLGGEYQPRSWRLFGNPVSVFLQYQHTWWGTANFNTPTSSPFFNYAFKREDDTIRLGVNVYLSR